MRLCADTGPDAETGYSCDLVATLQPLDPVHEAEHRQGHGRPQAVAGARLGRIALIGNALPRLCGLATFTTHVHDALRAHFHDVAVDHYAMVDPGGIYQFPPTVTGTVDQDDPESYRRAALAIEVSRPDLVWIQHEFGIFGGPAGSNLLDLVENISAPVVVTLHTVVDAPDPMQRYVVGNLARRASLLIVMADRARAILHQTYGITTPIVVIPHGVPDRPYVAPAEARRRLGLENRPTILTFGLLSPGKGIETMIRAMPAILARCPQALYSVVGATHPHLVAQEGEAYRVRLQALADDIGVGAAMRWDNRFLAEPELLDHIAAADLYVTPYRNPAQITSGTLAYAFGLGKPIVSTHYVHAEELLSDGRGVLVGADDVAGTAQAIVALLDDDVLRNRYAVRAYANSRAMTWQQMVERSIAAFEQFLDKAEVQKESGHHAAEFDGQGRLIDAGHLQFLLTD